MRELRFSAPLATVAKALAECESLSLPYYGEEWRAVVDALRNNNGRAAVLEAGVAFIEAAIPEEGDIHPKRAALVSEETTDTALGFYTPSGVTVALTARVPHSSLAHYISVTIDFGRDSKYLAAKMLAAVCFDQGTLVQVDGEDASCWEALSHVTARLAQEYFVV